MVAYSHHSNRVWQTALLVVGLTAAAAPAQNPDHPIITEVYTDPSGADGPVGREPANLHQEFIEIYLPACAELSPSLNCNALNLTLYEIEGDNTSSGLGLVNYRIDLPTFDLDSSDGLSGLPRPPSGVVVIGWVDYNDDVSDLAGLPGSRVALINGGITAATDFSFIAMNGDFGTGTTNFPTPGPGGVSSIDADEGEAASGIIQNGSGIYMLVNRDDPGYVQLFDDEHVPLGESADPALPGGLVLMTTALLDGYAGNDDDLFDVLDQPVVLTAGCQIDPAECVDLESVLPLGGAFSLLIPQIPELQAAQPDPGQANGYARVHVDVPKTTETLAIDDPVADALNAYRHIRNSDPFRPTPGRAVLVASPPELGAAEGNLAVVELLSDTTADIGLLTANVGGDFGIDISVSAAVSGDPATATFGPGTTAAGVAGQAYAFPSAAVTGQPSAVHLAEATAEITLTAVNSVPTDPPVLSPIATTTATARVLKPAAGMDANGMPLQTTVFLAVQGVVADLEVVNEFLTTSLGAHLAAQPDITALDTEGHGPALIDPATDFGDPFVVRPWVEEMPEDGEECTNWLNLPGPVGTLDLAQTVAMSAEALSGQDSYDDSLGLCGELPGVPVVRGISVNIPDTLTFGGSFSPSEVVHFAEATGAVGNAGSGFTSVTTGRTFELAIIDTHVRTDGSLESGGTDDFGIIIEVRDTEPAAQVVAGEFVFLSFSGGLQGADVDSLGVPPGGLLGTIILLDLDNLHDVLGIRAIEAVYVIDAGGSGEIDTIEAFSLNPAPPACLQDINSDGLVNPSDLAILLGAWGPNPGHPADFNSDSVVNAADLAQLLGAWGTCH